jgi:endonuclease G
MKLGFPVLNIVRSFDNYVLSYDRRNRVHHWVFGNLTEDALVYNESVDRSKCEFTEDTSVHPYFSMTYTYCCVYSTRLLMMDKETVRKM